MRSHNKKLRKNKGKLLYYVQIGTKNLNIIHNNYIIFRCVCVCVCVCVCICE